MHIISRKALREAGETHSGSAIPLDSWYRTVKAAKWTNLDDVRKTYRSADGVVMKGNVYTVFNIGGNNFRLVAGINYKTQRVFIKHVLTHAEYDKGDWKR